MSKLRERKLTWVTTSFLMGVLMTLIIARVLPTNAPAAESIAKEWIDLEQSQVPLLTLEQRHYIDKLPALRKCVDPFWMPLEAIKEGEHIGVISELLTQVEKVLQRKFELVETTSWADSLNKLRSGECDVLTSDALAGPSSDFYIKTLPFVNLHHVYITRHSAPMEVDFAKIKHNSIGIPRGYPTIDLLAEKYGYINFVEVDSVDDGVLMVSKGELYAFADILPVTSYSIEKQGLTNLKVGGHLDLDLPTVMSVRSDMPELVTILNKLFFIADRNISNQLLSKWISLDYEVQLDWNKLLKGLIFFFAVGVIILLWNRKLQLMNRELDKTNSKLRHLSESDALTGLKNRYYLHSVLFEEMVSIQQQYSIALVDIDHFKSLNDNYGHSFGDECLKTFSELMKVNFNKEGDHIIRFGGEEFLIISQVSSHSKFLKRLENLRVDCEQHQHSALNSEVIHFTASFGAIEQLSVSSTQEIESYLDKADLYLYQAKNSGRNRIVTAIKGDDDKQAHTSALA